MAGPEISKANILSWLQTSTSDSAGRGSEPTEPVATSVVRNLESSEERLSQQRSVIQRQSRETNQF